MSLLSAIADRLTADTSFGAAMTGGIGTTRKLAVLPGTVMETVSDPRPQHYKGFQAVRPTMVQVDIYARSEAEGALLREQAIAILVPAATVSGIRFLRAQVTNVRSGSALGSPTHASPIAGRQQPEIHRESIDFIFTHATA